MRRDGEAMLEAARVNMLEGIVAKRLTSTYMPGARSSDWLKLKHVLRQEFVIGGWSPVRMEGGTITTGALGLCTGAAGATQERVPPAKARPEGGAWVA